MSTAFKEVPRAVAESAEMDGANSWAALWRIYLPIARPQVLTLVLLSFLWTWNDYFLAADPRVRSGTSAADAGPGAFSGRYLVHVNLLSAAAITISAPVVALCLIFQRHFIRGILSGAVKE